MTDDGGKEVIDVAQFELARALTYAQVQRDSIPIARISELFGLMYIFGLINYYCSSPESAVRSMM